MRKLTTKMQIWLVRRATDQFRRKHKIGRTKSKIPRAGHMVTAWTGTSFEQVYSAGPAMLPPAVVCLQTNREETLEFLHRWHNRPPVVLPMDLTKKFHWMKEPKKPGGHKHIQTYFDYSRCQTLSTAAAVVLAAGYDRLATMIGKAPPTINLDQWSDPMFKKLYEIGFFEIVGLTENVAERHRDHGDTRTMRILSGSNAAGLEDVAQSLLGLSAYILGNQQLRDDIAFALNTALGEAMINVAKHAYPIEHTFKLAHVGKWWVTAEADRCNRILTVVFYDQGATIPVTFPTKKDLASWVRDLLRKIVKSAPSFEFENDAAYIEGAMQRGHTQTNEENRGLGLSQMKDLVDICGGGRITIYSRGGICEYEPGGQIKRSSHGYSIGGTLVEWIIQLPEGSHA